MSNTVRTVQLTLTDEEVTFITCGLLDCIEQLQRVKCEDWEELVTENKELIKNLEKQTFGKDAVVIKEERF